MRTFALILLAGLLTGGCGSSDGTRGVSGINAAVNGFGAGTFVSSDQMAYIDVEVGSTQSMVPPCLDGAPDAPGFPSGGFVFEAGEAYRITPAGQGFLKKIALTIRFGALAGESEYAPETVRLFRLAETAWVEVPSQIVPGIGVTAKIDSAGIFRLGSDSRLEGLKVAYMDIPASDMVVVGYNRPMFPDLAADTTQFALGCNGTVLTVRSASYDPAARRTILTVDGLPQFEDQKVGFYPLSGLVDVGGEGFAGAPAAIDGTLLSSGTAVPAAEALVNLSSDED